MSSKSRRNLLEKFGRLEEAPCLFLTVTYGQMVPSPDEGKEHVRAFLKRLGRDFPRLSAVWRLESQTVRARREGSVFIAHFHFILFNVSFIDMGEIQRIWGDVIPLKYWDLSGDVPREPFIRIEVPRSRNGVMWYVAKYVSKIEEPPSEERGTEVFASGFNYETKPAKPIKFWTGRCWGVFRGYLLPFAAVGADCSGRMSYRQVACMRRIVRRFQNSRGCIDKKRGFRLALSMRSGRINGFLLYTENPTAWLTNLAAVLGGRKGGAFWMIA